jgi:hypothetical protein
MSTSLNNPTNYSNSDLISENSIKTIPLWIVLVQCSCFAVLYSIWNYPLTNFLSDLCMVIGALLSVYILYIYRSFFKSREAIPFWLLIILLGWIVFHLLFLSNDFPLQLRELSAIWKRVVIAIIFALGFGIALVNSLPQKGFLILFYSGMLMPTLIFFGKYILNSLASQYNLVVPDFLKIYSDRDSVFFMYKTDYVSFCLPALALSLALLKINLEQNRVFKTINLLYLLAIFTILAVFLLNNIKNGVAHSAILISAFILMALNSQLNKLIFHGLHGENIKLWLLKLTAILLLTVMSAQMLINHVEKNPSWKSLLADSKVAVKVDQIDKWKYWGEKGYPLNEHHTTVSGTNYERLAWAIVGLRLLGENPLGYGLAQDSFRYLSKAKWPDSRLAQTHSGWLDLALGIGIPGIGLIFGALGLVMCRAVKNSHKYDAYLQQAVWSSRLIWVLWALLLLWCTTEISFKVHIIALMFWISFGVGITWRSASRLTTYN